MRTAVNRSLGGASRRVFSSSRQTEAAARFHGAALAATAVSAGVVAGMFWPASAACSATDRTQEAEARLTSLEAKAADAVLATSCCKSTFNEEGHRRTLRFALSVAAEQALPGRKLVGGFAVGDGYIFSFADGKGISQQELVAVNSALVKLVAADAAIEPSELPWLEAREALAGLPLSLKLLETRVSDPTKVLKCAGSTRLQTSALLASTGELTKGDPFTLSIQHGKNLHLSYSAGLKPQPAVAGSIEAQTEWVHGLGVQSLADLNELHGDGRGRKDFILAAEFHQEACLRDIVREIRAVKAKEGSAAEQDGLKSGVRVICIAGPTSSGKTTFATKLCQ